MIAMSHRKLMGGVDSGSCLDSIHRSQERQPTGFNPSRTLLLQSSGGLTIQQWSSITG